MRLIDEEGEQLGIVPLEKAREKAEDRNLDLAKAEKEAKKRQHTVEVKEVKFRPKIEEHDFDFKTRHAREFIEEGNKVKVTIMFRYRELRRPEMGEDLLDRIVEELSDIARVQSRTGLQGRNMTMVLVPEDWAEQ